MKKNNEISNNTFKELLLYKTPNGEVKVEIYLMNENLWLTQTKMAELFDVDRTDINKHLRNIFKEGELDKNSTCEKISQVQNEGGRMVTRDIEFYNLDAIISVGYRISSKQATMFRIWATKILKEYMIKGFAMDDERLKNPNYIFGKDYFDEQLERIRNIRSSERRFYQKITDIYAQCSADYDVNSEITKQFFAIVQNKLHYAITGKTAAEIIVDRANSDKENMGLTTWKDSPNGAIRKDDVSIAKNYLTEKELKNLNRIVTMYLDYAEDQAENMQIMYMKDWVERLNVFLQFNRKDILEDNGKITAEFAKKFSERELEKYQKKQNQLYLSDFDKLLLETKKIEKKN